MQGARHDRAARHRPTPDLHRHRRDRQLHQGRRSREQDAVGGVDADEAAGGAHRAPDLRARRPRLEAHRRRLTPARLRAAAGEAQCRNHFRILRRGAVRPRAARRAGRLRRPLFARNHGALLARLSERRTDRAVRAVGRPARTHRRQRDRPRHRHQLREQAHGGNLPARAAAVGDVEPAFDASRGTAAAGARAAKLLVAPHGDRTAGVGRAALSRAVLELERRRGGGGGALRTCGVGAGGVGPAARHARAHRRGRLPRTAELPGRLGAQCA